MSLRDHIAELRGRLLKALLFVGLGAVVGWILYPQILDVLKEPYCAAPAGPAVEPERGRGEECKLVFTAPLDGFVLRLKVGAICGVILAAPFWLYQLWAFVTPGLHRRERRWTVLFVGLLHVLFPAGAVLSYFTIEKALALLVGFAGRRDRGGRSRRRSTSPSSPRCCWCSGPRSSCRCWCRCST